MYRNENLRIALVLSELRPGGMERVVVHLANGLAARGMPVQVICLQNEGQLASELDSGRVQVHALQSFKSIDFWAVLQLRKLLRHFSPTLINLHDYASAPYAVAANLLSKRCPVVFTAHGLLYEGFDELQKRYRFFSRFFSSVTAVSEKVAARHSAYLAWSKPVPVIFNGVPVSERRQDLRNKVRQELGCSKDQVLFLAIGNPRPEKGFEDLIDAAAMLLDNSGHDQDFCVAVAGTLNESEYCRMLLQRAKDRNVQDTVRFLGYRSDTESLYSAADAFILSSRSEGLPMVILEAMMAGLPVIATKVGGVPDAVADNALLVDPARPDQLAQAMQRFVSDWALAGQFGRAGYEHARAHYGVDRMVDTYIECYRELLSTNRKTM